MFTLDPFRPRTATARWTFHGDLPEGHRGGATSSAVMYAPGMILQVGGRAAPGNNVGGPALASAAVIDITSGRAGGDARRPPCTTPPALGERHGAAERPGARQRRIGRQQRARRRRLPERALGPARTARLDRGGAAEERARGCITPRPCCSPMGACTRAAAAARRGRSRTWTPSSTRPPFLFSTRRRERRARAAAHPAGSARHRLRRRLRHRDRRHRRRARDAREDPARRRTRSTWTSVSWSSTSRPRAIGSASPRRGVRTRQRPGGTCCR